MPRKRYDVMYTDRHDITTDSGFACACLMALEIKEGGLAYYAPPCCGYCWLSSSRHKRCSQRPMGDESLSWVQLHNKIGCRVALLMCLCLVRRIHILLEHPRGSCIHKTPWMAALLEISDERLQWCWSQAHFYMGEFGSWTPKPSLAVGPVPYVGALAKKARKVSKNVRKAQQTKTIRIQVSLFTLL